MLGVGENWSLYSVNFHKELEGPYLKAKDRRAAGRAESLKMHFSELCKYAS